LFTYSYIIAISWIFWRKKNMDELMKGRDVRTTYIHVMRCGEMECWVECELECEKECKME
jgi:hypothetical protein